MKPDNSHQFLVGTISYQDQLKELWAIDNAAYGAASITYDKFRDWWRAFPPGLQVLHWKQRIGGAIGLWPLSDRSAARLIKARIKESALTGRTSSKEGELVLTRLAFIAARISCHARQCFPLRVRRGKP